MRAIGIVLAGGNSKRMRELSRQEGNRRYAGGRKLPER